MNNANLSQEISRLYKDLSDHVLARDWEGTSRIYQELLRAGQSSDMLMARVPALQNTSALKLFGQQQAAQEHGSEILDSPTTQGSAEPGFTRKYNRTRRRPVGMDKRLGDPPRRPAWPRRNQEPAISNRA